MYSFSFTLLSFLLCVCVFVCSYVEKYDLQEPSDNIQHVLKRIAVKLKKTQRVKAITGVGKRVLILRKDVPQTVLLENCPFGKIDMKQQFNILGNTLITFLTDSQGGRWYNLSCVCTMDMKLQPAAF